MNADWHYARDGRSFGPFTAEQLRQLAASGLLAPTDVVRSGAGGAWVPAGTVPGWAFPSAPPAAAVTAAPVAARPRSETPTAERPAAARNSAARRSAVGMVVVWAAALPLGLVLADRVLRGGGGVPAVALGAGGVVALAAWSYLGLRALASGVLPTFSGRVLRRPVLHRVGGLALLYAGWALFAAMWNDARDRLRAVAEVGPPAAAAADERVAYAGGEEVLYPSGQRTHAERLGEALKDIGEFDGKAPKTFAIERGAGGWVVKVVLTDAARRNPAVRDRFARRLGVQLAALAFPDEPVEFQLCDPGLTAHAGVAVPPAGRFQVTAREDVYYLGPIQADARRLADYLRTRLTGTGEKAFVLARPSGVWQITLLHAAAEGLSTDGEAAAQLVAGDVSLAVFGGGPVEVVLLDRADQPGRTFQAAAPPPRAPPKTFKGRTVQEWAAMLDDADVPTRRLAAAALDEFGPGAAPAVPQLIRLLTDGDAGVRQCATTTLGVVAPGDRDVVAGLAGRLTDPDPYTLKLAVTALGKHGPAARAAIPNLAALAGRRTDRETRERLATALGAIDPKDPLAVEGLVAILGEDKWAEKSPPMDALARSGRDAVPALAAGLKDRKRMYTRWMAVRALGRIGPEAAAAVPALIGEFAASPDARFGPFWSEGNQNFDFSLVSTLSLIGKAAATRVIEASGETAAESDRRAACNLLAKMEKCAAVRGRLAAVVREDDRVAAVAAAEGLGRYGSEAKNAIPDLLRLYRVSPEPEKWGVAKAIFLIDPETARKEDVRQLPLYGR